MIHFVVSDAHDAKERSLRLSKVRTTIEKLAGPEEALKIFRRRPAHVLRGERIKVKEPIEGNGVRQRGWRFWRPCRIRWCCCRMPGSPAACRA